MRVIDDIIIITNTINKMHPQAQIYLFGSYASGDAHPESDIDTYSEYKATEYDWLGNIPTQWRWLFLAQTCEEQGIKNTGNVGNISPCTA